MLSGWNDDDGGRGLISKPGSGRCARTGVATAVYQASPPAAPSALGESTYCLVRHTRLFKFMISGCASDLLRPSPSARVAASSPPSSRPVTRLRTSEVVTESIPDLISLACELKTSTASKRSWGRGTSHLLRSSYKPATSAPLLPPKPVWRPFQGASPGTRPAAYHTSPGPRRPAQDGPADGLGTVLVRPRLRSRQASQVITFKNR